MPEPKLKIWWLLRQHACAEIHIEDLFYRWNVCFLCPVNRFNFFVCARILSTFDLIFSFISFAHSHHSKSLGFLQIQSLFMLIFCSLFGCKGSWYWDWNEFHVLTACIHAIESIKCRAKQGKHTHTHSPNKKWSLMYVWCTLCCTIWSQLARKYFSRLAPFFRFNHVFVDFGVYTVCVVLLGIGLLLFAVA